MWVGFAFALFKVVIEVVLYLTVEIRWNETQFLLGRAVVEEQPFTLSKGVERLQRGHKVFKWASWLSLNAYHLTQVHAFFNVVHMKPFCWKEVLAVLSLNYWNTKLVNEGLKRENWDPRRCVSTRALPILWVTGCQLAQTPVNQDGQRNQNHLRGKSYSSGTPAKFELPSVSQTFCLLLLQPHVTDNSL